MEALKSLLKPRESIKIPQWRTDDNDDPVDLQVKALYYMFRRFNIAKTQVGMIGQEMKLQAIHIAGLSEADQEKLDHMYNKLGFEAALFLDPHRVLTDWIKNRFRSMLILSATPQMEKLPRFHENGFKYLVLPPDASKDEYVRTLTLSDIYGEHQLPMEVKQAIATHAFDEHKPQEVPEWGKVILAYVQRVGVEVQVARLYKASLRGSPRPASPERPDSPLKAKSKFVLQAPDLTKSARSPSPTQSPPVSPRMAGRTSPDRLSPIPRGFSPSAPGSPQSPTRIKLSVASSPSMATPAGDSPGRASPKLRVKPSLSTMKLPVPDPNVSPTLSPVSQNLLHHLPKAAAAGAVSESGRKQLLAQARLAVKARLDREQQAVDIESA